MTTEPWTERIEKMHTQLKAAQDDLAAKLGSLTELSMLESDHQSDLQVEIARVSGQLDQERQTNSKLGGDLAKSLELNLKLQFEIEEIRTKANQILNEEKKHNQYLTEKNRGLAHELELSSALCQEIRSELSKGRDKYQAELATAFGRSKDLQEQLTQAQANLQQVSEIAEQREQQILQLVDSLTHFEKLSQQQNETLQNLSSVAEKKIVELKMTLDKKSAEAQDYYSHLQQSLSQASILKQENSALKDYINKMTALHQSAQT